MKYFVVVQASAWSLGPGRFAVESAFANHLVELRQRVGPAFDELVLVGPSLTPAEYAARSSHMAEVDAATTGVSFLPAFTREGSRPAFLLSRLWPLWRWLRQLFRSPCVVQSGMSTELARPLMFLACLAARSRGHPVVFVVDMDFRQHASQFLAAGEWSRASYLVNRWGYDLLKRLQLWLAPRLFDLCLLKSAALVRDYGRGRPNVHNFYDTVHAEGDIVQGDALEARLARRGGADLPLEAIYFGRLAANKGIDRMIDAVAASRGRGRDVRLRIVGDGPCLAELHGQVDRLGLGAAVTFRPAVPYGPALFDEIDGCDVMLAAPLIEDTPRAAFDAFARGLPILAFDIGYFRDLAAASGAVVLTAWPQVEAMADALVHLARQRPHLGAMSRRARDFACRNTQAEWLDRRIGWLQELVRKPVLP